MGQEIRLSGLGLSRKVRLGFIATSQIGLVAVVGFWAYVGRNSGCKARGLEAKMSLVKNCRRGLVEKMNTT